MKNNKEIVVIIQGATVCDNIEKLKNDWESFPIIFSTWDDGPVYCYDDSDVVLFNKRPETVAVGNLNLQRVSSLNGFMKAKEMGYKKIQTYILETENGVQWSKVDLDDYLEDNYCDLDITKLDSYNPDSRLFIY